VGRGHEDARRLVPYLTAAEGWSDTFDPHGWDLWASPRNTEGTEGVPQVMLPGSCRWWPFFGVFVFLWIVPAVFGIGFRCDKDEPEVPPATDPGANDPSLSVSTSTSPPTNPWASAVLPLLAGGGFLLSRMRRGDD